MKRFKLLALLSLAALVAVTTSCEKDKEVNYCNLTITVQPPSGTSGSLSGLVIKATNKAALNTSDLTLAPAGNNTYTAQVPFGSYKFVASGTMGTQKVGGKTDNVNAAGTQASVTVSLSAVGSDGFVIKELYSYGVEVSGTPSHYMRDSYLIITNNSTTALFADGLCIFKSEFLTDTKIEDLDPDRFATDFTVDLAYMIPGSGNENLVLPGESLIIAAEAINHKELHSASVDLSNVDFEIYDGPGEDGDGDTDNPSIPNMIAVLSGSASYFSFSVQTNMAWAIGRLPQGVNETNFTTQLGYDYTGSWDFMGFGDPEDMIPMDDTAYAIPNNLIDDIITLGLASDFYWMVASTGLDIEYFPMPATSSGKYGKSLQRKAGTPYLQKTNNSSEDIELKAKTR